MKKYIHISYLLGTLLPTRISIKPDRTYELEICTPMSTWLLFRAAGIRRGGQGSGKLMFYRLTKCYTF